MTKEHTGYTRVQLEARRGSSDDDWMVVIPNTGGALWAQIQEPQSRPAAVRVGLQRPTAGVGPVIWLAGNLRVALARRRGCLRYSAMPEAVVRMHYT